MISAEQPTPEEPTPLDPEDLFWNQIQEEPQNPLPRLLYADWCDENDRAVMSLVQRWLAARGRVPLYSMYDRWVWGSEESPPASGIQKAHTLPVPLFRELELINESSLRATAEFVTYRTQRQAEEALIPAWAKATAPRWLGVHWKPDYRQAIGFLTLPPTSVAPETPPTDQPSRIRSMVLVVGLLGLLGGVQTCGGGGRTSAPGDRPKAKSIPATEIDSPFRKLQPLPPFSLKELPEWKDQDSATERSKK